MAGQQGGGQADNSLGFLYILIAIFVALLAAWFLFHAQIVWLYFAIKSAQISVVGIFTSGLSNTQQAISTINPEVVSFDQLAQVATAVGNYLKYPVAGILIMLAIILYSTSAKTAFRKTYSMQRLMDQEKENWPHITPISGLDLVNEDIDTGPWAMAEPPREFAKRHRLLKKEKLPLLDGQLAKDQKLTVTVIKAKANQVFVRQLGRPFQGPEKMAIHYRALFAISIAKANADRKPAIALLDQIAISSGTGKLDFTGADELWKKHVNSKLVQKALSNHAYELTLMATIVALARTDGVMASAEFLWLKPLDRQLWYVLNTVGRHVAPPEAAGPYAHWLAEKAIGRKLTVPMVEEATTGLELAVKEILYDPEDEL